MASISDSWDSEKPECKCKDWVMCDYCKKKKICLCSHGIICHNCESALALTDNSLKTENCKYCNGDKSLCDCYSCECCCRQNSRIFFEILKNGLGLNKKTDFTYKDIIEKYKLDEYSSFKEYIEKNVGIENIKILYYYSLGCTNCCKRHQDDKPRPLSTDEFCITIQDSDSEEEN